MFPQPEEKKETTHGACGKPWGELGIPCGMCGNPDIGWGKAGENHGKCYVLLQFTCGKSPFLPVEIAEIHCGARDVKICV
jgi:hypothetical protein